jgi:hypothetical protein
MSERIARDPEPGPRKDLVPMSGTVEWSGNHFRLAGHGVAACTPAARKTGSMSCPEDWRGCPGSRAAPTSPCGRAADPRICGSCATKPWRKPVCCRAGKPLDTFRRSGIDAPVARRGQSLLAGPLPGTRGRHFAIVARGAGRLSGESGAHGIRRTGLVMAAMRSMGMLGADPPVRALRRGRGRARGGGLGVRSEQGPWDCSRHFPPCTRRGSRCATACPTTPGASCTIWAATFPRAARVALPPWARCLACWTRCCCICRPWRAWPRKTPRAAWAGGSWIWDGDWSVASSRWI